MIALPCCWYAENVSDPLSQQRSSTWSLLTTVPGLRHQKLGTHPSYNGKSVPSDQPLSISLNPPPPGNHYELFLHEFSFFLFFFLRFHIIDIIAPVLWPPDAKGQLIRKDPDAGKGGRQEEKETTEDEMVDGITSPADMSLHRLQETVKDREAWPDAVHGVAKNWTQLSDWTTSVCLCVI